MTVAWQLLGARSPMSRCIEPRRANLERASPTATLRSNTPGSPAGPRPPGARDRLPTAYRVVFATEMAARGALGVLLLGEGPRALGRSGSRPPGRPRPSRSFLLLGGVILTPVRPPPRRARASGPGAFTDRLRAGALVVGLGIAVKLYPVLRPAARDRRLAQGGRRELGIVVGLAALPGAFGLPALPPSLAGRGARLHRPTARTSAPDREPRFRRAPGAPSRVRALARWASGSGSQNLTGTGARRRRRPGDRPGRRRGARLGFVRARAGDPGAPGPPRGGAGRVRRAQQGAVLAQFLVWLVLLSLSEGPAGAAALWLAVLACALTAAWFPVRYWELVREFDPLAPACPRARDDAPGAPRRPHVAGHGTRTSSIALARPVAGSHVTTAPSGAHRRMRSRTARACRSHPADGELRLDPDHRVVRPGHPDVGQGRGTAREHAGVGSLHVGVRAEHGRHAPVEPGRRATFSLVASAWTSTTITGSRCGPRRRGRRRPPHAVGGVENSDPSRLSTATGVPSRASTNVRPLPGSGRLEVGRATTVADEAR